MDHKFKAGQGLSLHSHELQLGRHFQCQALVMLFLLLQSSLQAQLTSLNFGLLP